jgi:hypothetical protein
MVTVTMTYSVSRLSVQCMEIAVQCMEIAVQCMEIAVQCMEIAVQCMEIAVQCLSCELEAPNVLRHSGAAICVDPCADCQESS